MARETLPPGAGDGGRGCSESDRLKREPRSRPEDHIGEAAHELDPGKVIARLEPLLLLRRVERMRRVLAGRSDQVVFLFEDMVDPHNLSAALRSLEAFAFQDVHLVNPAARIGFARKITQGSERWLTVTEHGSLAACVAGLRAAGYRIWASHMASAPVLGPVPLQEIDFGRRAALLFGNEHEGVSEQALALADGTFRVEMLGFVESLNLSVASAICAFHARRELTRLAAAAGDPARFALAPERQRALYAQWLQQSVRAAEKILAEE